MGQTILTKDQQKVLKYIAAQDTLKQFYLSGGTALAEYYLHHRLSDDLDFFTDQPIDSLSLARAVQGIGEVLSAKKVTTKKIFDRNLYFFEFGNTELKLEFTYYPFKRLEKSAVINGVYIDSFRDASVNKLMTLMDRVDPKDFVDMYYILEHTDCKKLVNDAKKKFGVSITNFQLGTEFSKVKAVSGATKAKNKAYA